MGVRADAALHLVDLRGDGLIRMGIPTHVVRARSHEPARLRARALWAHDATPDGIINASSLTGEANIALFDRALARGDVDHGGLFDRPRFKSGTRNWLNLLLVAWVAPWVQSRA
jgi:hypothetical protein